MPDGEHQNCDRLMLDVANDAVITYAVTPESPLFPVERLPPLSRIFRGLNPLAKKTDDRLLSNTV